MHRDPLLLLLCPSSMWVRCRPRLLRRRRVRAPRVGAGLHRVAHGPCGLLGPRHALGASGYRFRCPR